MDEFLETDAVHVLHDEEMEFAVAVDVVGADDVGWRSWATARASRWKRSMAPGSSAWLAGSTLTATGRCMMRWEQR